MKLSEFLRYKKQVEYRSFLKTLHILKNTNKSGNLISNIEAFIYFYDKDFKKYFQLYNYRVGRREWRVVQRLLDDINKL